MRFCPSFKVAVRDDRRARGRRPTTCTRAHRRRAPAGSSTSATSASSATSSARTRRSSEQEWVIDFPRLMLRSLADPGRAGQGVARAPSCSRAPTCRARSRPRSRRSSTGRTTSGSCASAHGEGDRHRQGPAAARRSPRCGSRSGSGAAPRRPRAGTAAARRRSRCSRRASSSTRTRRSARRWSASTSATASRCELPDGQVCCGMPWLDAGDVDKFEEHARDATSALLADAVQAGNDVVVPQPTCAYVLKNEYPDFLGTDDARLVAEHTFDASEYLMAAPPRGAARHRLLGGHDLRHDHLAGRLPLPGAADRARRASELMELTGAKVTMVERCSAIDGTWGLRAENVEMARKIAKPLMEKVAKSDDRARRRRLPPREHRDQGGDGQDARRTRCRCWRAPTGSTRSRERR